MYKALKNEQFEIYYQPQFNREEAIIGCEALVRWCDDELGVLRPDEFIPIAENTGLILELGVFVVEKAFTVLHQWHKRGIYGETFSVNVSIRQLLYEPFIEKVEGLCQRYFSTQNDKQIVVFEITEHVFSVDVEKVISTMKRLKKFGISFSIDDFGTGYSSLSYLQKLPIEEIKIDKTFVLNMLEDKQSEKMITTIISIAKNFNFTIVAEGVETEEQFERLKSHYCDIYQGFYFDEALSQRDFEQKYLTI